ncbi:ABC-2 type transport system permease protein [Eubacterium ruminantium]|nr:ABC-2 type transport system permease protein [Eubacterium ruminantium]
MFSIPLFKQSVKSNWVMWSAITGVMTVLCIQFAALEMTRPLLFQIFYGMMTTILPGIYVLVTSNKLIAGQVDRGSMAYVLSTPIRRETVVITQTVFMTLSLVLMFAVETVAHILINSSNPVSFALLGYKGMAGNITSNMILEVNISAFVVCLAMAGVCMALSGIFNSSKYSIGFAGVFVGESILVNMLSMFGKLGVGGLKNFKYATICSFYDYEKILFCDSKWINGMIIPVMIALVAFAIATIVFKKKDLPL